MQYSSIPDFFWIPISAVLLVFIIDRAPHLQAIFRHPIPQYLGQISFSIYLVHGPLLWSLGRSTAKIAVAFTGRETVLQYCAGIFLSATITMPVIVWVADVVAKLVDAKAVRFGNWAYGKLLHRNEKRFEMISSYR